MESGAFVNVYTFYWGMNVLVHVLGQDFGKTEGLCGTYNNNPQDDFVIQNDDGSLDESLDRHAFVSSWRYIYIFYLLFIICNIYIALNLNTALSSLQGHGM